MWTPAGYLTWNAAFSRFRQLTEEVLERVCGSPESANGRLRYVHTAEYYIKNSGFAEDYEEARLVIALTATWLMSNFMDDFPPVAVSIEGRELNLDWIYFTHRDQLELCYFQWPLSECPEFKSLFDLTKRHGLKAESIYDRFPFINSETGMLRTRNGARQHLVNGLGLSEVSADQALVVASSVRDFQLCWKETMDNASLRTFCEAIEVDDNFRSALDELLGPAKAPTDGGSEAEGYRTFGRPRKIEEARDAISSCFPDGTSGSSHKQIRRVIIERLGLQYSERTIGRALASRQK
jgi:hypothetical protein